MGSCAAPSAKGDDKFITTDYLQQCRWKNGLRRAAAPDCMADIARKLTPEDIGALAAWLSSQPVAASYAPEPAGALRLPAECGSQAQR
ncbi:Uncharacterised protein [Achromobacter ruhlandii]|nr:Uncharacterised protein [Achromobacter ruhlandii]CUK23959.1 Uncharacterised protein [Achromobacter ruhlandii]